MVEKGGTCVNGIASEMLIDSNGHFERAKPYLGALGGQIQQWYYIFSAINHLYKEDELIDYYAKMRRDPTVPELKKP